MESLVLNPMSANQDLISNLIAVSISQEYNLLPGNMKLSGQQ